MILNPVRLLLIILCFVSSGLAISPAAATTTSEREPLRVHGTFVQLLSAHADWTPADWQRLFAHFRNLRLTELVVQWTVYDGNVFHAAPAELSESRSPLENILQLADEAGMTVLVGLAFDEAYWQEIAGEPSAVQQYLKGLSERSATLAAELAPMVARHPSFAGWYIPQEIDDLSWREPTRRQLMYDFMSELSQSLLTVTPRTHIAVSGFANAALDPLAFQNFWEQLFIQAAGVDRVLFQDGIGAHKLDLHELPLYTAAIRRAADAQARQVTAIVELFHQVAGPPLDENAFRAVPASLERIVHQLYIAQGYAVSTVAFSVPEYLSPLGGPDAEALYERYLAACLLRSCGGSSAVD